MQDVNGTSNYLMSERAVIDNGRKNMLSQDEKNVKTDIGTFEIENDVEIFITGTEKVKFSSTFSTYMTLLGFSIGMSDFWRFPFLAYRNGGGIGISIVAAYCLWMVGTAVLRMWIVDFLVNSFTDPLPWTLCTNKWNTPNCINKFSRSQENIMNSSFNNISSLSTDTSGMIINNHSLTTALESAMFNYSTSTSGTILSQPEVGQQMTSEEEFWQYRVLELSSGITDLYPIQWRHIIALAIFRVIILFGLIKSIKSIEKVIYVTATIPFFLTIAIFARSLMQPGSSIGLFHFINPDFSKIVQPRVWIEATLMAFYTLGFGWGANMLLGSHAHFKENCLRTSIVLPLANMFMAAFSGLVCFSVLGNMSYAYNVDISDIINAGMSVGIVAYITALSSLPLPQLWTVFFLLSVLLTGIDGQLVPMDMLMQLIGDLFPKVKSGFRLHALVVVTIVFFLCSIPTCTGGGAYIFLWMDWYNGAWVGPIVAFIQLIVVAWVYGMDRFNDDVYMMIGRPIPGILRIMTAFIAPICVLAIFITSCMEYVPPSYGSYVYSTTTRALGWCSVAIVMSPIIFQALFTMKSMQGPAWKKLRKLLQPLDIWGPCETEYYNEYHNTKHKYNYRSFTDLFYYNITGFHLNKLVTIETENIKT
ncbi:Sodium- and chloride-dependent GABA transporter 1 [Mactra antiquata]